MSDNLCKTCRYAEWKKTATGRLSPTGDGMCAYDVWHPVPCSTFVYDYKDGVVIKGGFINRHRDINHCDVYEDKWL